MCPESKHQSSMQTVKSREPEAAPQLEPPDEKAANKPEVAYRYQPGKAAVLSLIPGLGHFYVGQPVVGTLCFLSSVLGLTFLATVVAGKQIYPVVASVAQTFGVHLDKTMGAPHVAASPIAITLYILSLVYLGLYFASDAYKQAIRKSLMPAGFKSDAGVTFTGSTSFSYLLHCLLLVVCAIGCLFMIKVPDKVETVIEIELEPPPVVIPPPPPPAPRPKPKAEAPKVERKEPVKTPVQPPKPTPVPIAVKPIDTPVADNPSPTPVSQPEAGSSTGTGSQGSASSGTGTGESGNGKSDDVDLSDYISAMEKKIRKSWFPPKGEETKKIVLKFKINSAGAASSVRLKASSGIMIADEAAITAVKTASPFAPLPKGAPDPVEILFTFDYSVFGGGKATIK